MLGMEQRLHQYEPLFGEWYIRGEIGSGGFGRVYRAEYRDAFGGVYASAIKLVEIIPEASVAKTSEEIFDMAKKAYESEIGTLQKLRGASNIVQMDDHAIKEIRENGKIVGYDLIIRMELLESLNHLLRQQETELLQPEEIQKLAKHLTYALVCCHSVNIMHRDINPGNIFRNTLGEYKLGDFGIAKQMIGTMRAQTAIGTKNYVAPEVYARAGLTPDSGTKYDSSADIYSLGLVLYQLANGNNLPFFREGMMASERSRAVERRLNGEALPMPMYAGEALGRVILKACAFQPSDRYTSAQELLDALNALQQPQVVLQQKDTSPQDMMTYWQSTPQSEFPLLSLLCLSEIPTPEISYLAEKLLGIKHDDTPTGVLTPRMATHLPPWTIRAPWMVRNRLNVYGYTSISERAFHERRDLVSVQCGSSVKEIGKEAFLRCVNMKRIDCASGLDQIGERAFAYCTHLKQCHLPNTVRVFGSQVFTHCTSLQSLRIPDGTQVLGDQLCDGCINLNQVILPSTLRSIGVASFRHCGLQRILLPDRCVLLGDRTFEGCSLLKSVQLSLQLKTIPQSCFAGCKMLAQIDLPFRLKDIREKAFFECSSLKQMVIPEGVERIGTQAFANCSKLSVIRIPNSVTHIGDDAFTLFNTKMRKNKVTVLTNRNSYTWQYCKQHGIRVREP